MMASVKNGLSFAGKTVIVTGSSSGIGAETAKRFAQYGANVVVTGRSETGLRATKDSCLAVGATEKSILLVPGDLRKPEFRSHLVETTAKQFGTIDILVNNAAFVSNPDILTASPEEVLKSYHENFDLNVVATLDLTKKCLPYLLKTKGNVVNISSAAGSKAFPVCYNYCMSKAAIEMLTKCMALDLGPTGVRVNTVSPGPIDTLFLWGNAEGEELAKRREFMLGTTMLNQIGECSDVANVIVFVASGQAKFMTGANIAIDGGVANK